MQDLGKGVGTDVSVSAAGQFSRDFITPYLHDTLLPLALFDCIQLASYWSGSMQGSPPLSNIGWWEIATPYTHLQVSHSSYVLNTMPCDRCPPCIQHLGLAVNACCDLSVNDQTSKLLLKCTAGTGKRAVSVDLHLAHCDLARCVVHLLLTEQSQETV